MNVLSTERVLGIPASAPAIELRGIVKRYGAVTALRGVSLVAEPGRIHAVVGENGAGKSTLISVAAGVVRADEGSVVFGGRIVEAPTARSMRDLGLSVVNQHPAIAPQLTVAENLMLAVNGLTEPLLPWARGLLARAAREGMGIDPRDRVDTLTMAQLHVVEIAKALAADPAVLILDEPTEPFGAADVAWLVSLLTILAQAGTAIIYISHRLHEVLSIADTVSFLRDGALVTTRPREGLAMSEMVTLIAGRPMDRLFPPKPAIQAGPPCCRIEQLTGLGFGPADLALQAGEIVGLAGIEGQGQRDFLRALAGLGAVSAGTVAIGGRAISLTSRTVARRAGIGFVTDDRHAEGLFLPWPIRSNISLSMIGRLVSHGMIDSGAEHRLAATMADTFQIKTPSLDTAVANLSGGNQQKVLFAREAAAHPALLLIDEPTKGIDIGARLDIYVEIRRLAAEGTAIVVVAAEGLELQGLCDRVLVFSRGRVVAALTGEDVTEPKIAAAMTGVSGVAPAAAQTGRQSSLKRLLTGDRFPAAPLVALTLGIGATAAWAGNGFLSADNMSALASLLAILVLVSAGQFVTFAVGGIDLAVGPVAGLAVVLASFVLVNGAGPGVLVLGVMAILGLSVLIGLVHALLIVRLRLSPVVVTLATFVGLQGVALLLRPQPAGMIADNFVDTVKIPVFGVPAGLIVAVALAIVLEVWLARSRSGMALRAVGSNLFAAHRMGVSRTRAVTTAYVLSAGLAGLAGLLLSAEIGIGSATTGSDYSLTSITAVVLSGAAVSGGRGSFISVLAAAAMMQVIINVTSFLNLDSAWQYWLVGGATLIGATVYGRLRGRHHPNRFTREGTLPMGRTLIHNATVISVDPEIGTLRGADILIDGSTIAAIGRDLTAADAEVIDATGMIATPGFIDTHRHTWQSLLRGTAADWTLAQYFSGVRVVMGGLYSADDMYIANHLGAMECLDAGITTLYDWSHNNNTPDHADEAIRGLRDAGIRAVFGYGNSNDEWVPVSHKPSNFADVARVRTTHFSSDDQLLTMAFAARGPQFTTLDITEDDFHQARALGLRITVHVGDGLWGMSKPVVQMQERGLLGPDVTYVHCNTLADEDFRLIGESGGTASIAPELELHMGHGFPATLKLLENGVRPSISIDIVTSIGGDMFGAMRALLAGTRAVVNGIALREGRIVDPLPLMTPDVLSFATIEGARACGLAHKTGSLTPGKQADIVLIDTDSLNMFPLNNAVAAVVEAAHVGNIDSVFVAGKARKRGGKLLDFDIKSLRRKVDTARDALFERAGVPTDGTWLPRPYGAPAEVEF